MINITELPKYDVYKDSGNEWLGVIPKDWAFKKFKYLARVKKGKIPKRIVSVDSFNLPPYLSMDYLRGTDAKQFVDDRSAVLVEDGAILLLWDGSNAGEFVLGKWGVVSSTLAHVDFFSVNKKFAWYACQLTEMELRSTTVGMGIPHVDGEQLKNSILAIPSPNEQVLIANFLDKKTTQIDDAIAIKEQQISLLKERKQIIIQQAVTQGLDPNVPMKDSGVDWIGKIPAHWDAKRLKYLGKSIIGLTYSPNDLSDEKGGTLVARSSNLYEGKFKYGEKENAYVNCFIPEHLKLKKGDILICSRNGSRDLIGKCAFVSDADEGNSFGAFTTVFRSKHNEYLFCILNSDVFKMLSGTFLTSTINQLTVGNLNSIFVPLPPSKNERDGIITYINRLNGDVERAIEYQKIQIERLKEYKATLINSAVTGKIKITPEMIEK